MLPGGRIAAQVKAGLNAQQPAIVAQATQAALSRIRTALDEQATKLTADVTSALKKAFTDAITTLFFWGLFIIGAGFVLTLFLPELALRDQTEATVPEASSTGAARRRDDPGAPPPRPPRSPCGHLAAGRTLVPRQHLELSTAFVPLRVRDAPPWRSGSESV